MSARTDALLWAQRVVGRKGAAAHQLLEIAPDAGLDAAQEAFQRIARMAHPDLHRTTLTSEELELVTTAYARAAAAYQEIRTQKAPSGRMRPINAVGTSEMPKLAATTLIPTSPSPYKAVAVPEISLAHQAAGGAASAQMTSKALVHYRKAELCLRRGEMPGAVLQLKMAIASDPHSAFLRTALSEVEAELRKKP